MSLSLLIITASLFLIHGTEHIQVLSHSSKPEPILLNQEGRKLSLECEEAHISIALPSGKRVLTDLLMVYDPQTGLFWWTHQLNSGTEETGSLRARFLSDSIFFLTGSKLVSFRGGVFVEIRESSEQDSSFEQGFAHVLDDLEAKRTEIESSNINGSVLVNLARSLEPSFLHLKGSAGFYPQPKLRQVSMSGDNWCLILDGPNGDYATIFLDSKYQVISARVEPRANSK